MKNFTNPALVRIIGLWGAGNRTSPCDVEPCGHFNVFASFPFYPLTPGKEKTAGKELRPDGSSDVTSGKWYPCPMYETSLCASNKSEMFSASTRRWNAWNLPRRNCLTQHNKLHVHYTGSNFRSSPKNIRHIEGSELPVEPTRHNLGPPVLRGTICYWTRGLRRVVLVTRKASLQRRRFSCAPSSSSLKCQSSPRPSTQEEETDWHFRLRLRVDSS